MKLKYISWLPAVCIMVTIFIFSSKPAVTSDESSMTIANGILNVYENITDTQLKEDVRNERLGVIDHIVRKSAHFTEYLLLAAALGFHFLIRRKKGWKLFVLSSGIAALYAATDEFHQLFITGRSAQVKDVLLDTTGAVTGMLIFFLVINITEGRRNKRKADIA